jgi:hypothetical protein
VRLVHRDMGVAAQQDPFDECVVENGVGGERHNILEMRASESIIIRIGSSIIGRRRGTNVPSSRYILVHLDRH